jgi:hypothetical protein
MPRFKVRRPSPSMAVAITALIIATAGTAMAASKLVSGDKLITKGSLSGNRLRSHTITGKQVNLSKLGTVPQASHAVTTQLATNALNAGHATTAGTADFATTAATATTATTANGLPALVWVPLTLLDGWSSYTGSTTRTPAVALDAEGIVHFRGTIKGGTTSSVAVLPAQFWPSANVWLAADELNTATGRLLIDTSGNLFATSDPSSSGSATAFTSLDGITYAAG